jgi:hypothetical protein
MREELEDMKKEVEKVKEESDLFRILKMEDKKNKRLCSIVILLIILLLISVSYTIYLHNDIGTEATTTETYEVDQQNESGNNNYVNGNGNEVN